MVPVPRKLSLSSSSRYVHVLHLAFSTAFRYVTQRDQFGQHIPRHTQEHATHTLQRRVEIERGTKEFTIFIVLIPVLVLLSGLFAGLTLGYMSLDETQLNVLSVSGTPKQREYASKIKPIRKNGHLLLVTLLLSNMIVNETLPIIADPVLGGGLPSVVVSTALIVVFSEIIPQSLFTRHGLYLGAKMAGFTTVLIYSIGIISWPVAKFLEWVLGPHHGIIYRRAELKELIAMHSNQGELGGDLKRDTITIIGATLDLQEKVVKQAMTPIEDVFMLSIDAKLDYDLLKKICETGHSRVPVYEEIEIPIPPDSSASKGMLSNLPGIASNGPPKERTQRVKKILGILLVKNCVMLDPKDATPIRSMPLNKVPFIPNNEPLLGILDKFQEGRSHMAIVSRFSVEKAQSVKKAVKRGLTQRLRERVGMGDTDSSDSSSSSEDEEKSIGFSLRKRTGLRRKATSSSKAEKSGGEDNGEQLEAISEISREKSELSNSTIVEEHERSKPKKKKKSAVPSATSPREQSMPADAVLAKEGAEDFLQNFDPAVMPVGIITLEDVLEELIGEEIYDEFDVQGAHGDPYRIPDPVLSEKVGPADVPAKTSKGQLKQLTSLGFLRSRSAPPVRRDVQGRGRRNSAPKGGQTGAEDSSRPTDSYAELEEQAPSTPVEAIEERPERGDGVGVESDDLIPQRGPNPRMASSAPATRAPSPSNSGVPVGPSASLPANKLLSQQVRDGDTPVSRRSLDGGVGERAPVKKVTLLSTSGTSTPKNVARASEDSSSGGQEEVAEPLSRGAQRGMAFKSRPVTPIGELQRSSDPQAIGKASDGE